MLYCKGADSFIERLLKTEEAASAECKVTMK